MLKKILLFLLIVAVIGGFFAFDKYQQIFAPNVPAQLSNEFLHVPSNSSYVDLVKILDDQSFILDTVSFGWVADMMKYKKKKIRAGRFKIAPGWSNRQLIGHLRNGKQATVNVILTNERFSEQVAGKAAGFIEADSVSIVKMMNSREFLQDNQLTRESLISLFIPNTYEFYWNQDAFEFLKRMKKENENFWIKNDRLAKAKALNLTKEEVYTIASIVEKETNYNPEKPTIAGVYLNRLERGMKLQADPTVVFANRDFGIRRVLNRHLEFDSPYNTYLYEGLPPGPISMASISSLDAVLNHEDHKYLYFCAKPDNSGAHAFAKNLAGHNQNARRFHNWLRQRGIRN